MITPTPLTERYVSATVRSLKPAAQEDVRSELQASIADAIEARLEHGEPREAAERAVLTELGDPDILAAGYADRPLHLIGPRYYLTWLRLLKTLLIIVPLCAVGGVALAQTLAGASVGQTIGEVAAVGASTVVHLCFWVTLVFVMLERTGADTGTDWDVGQLPEPSADGAGKGELIASLVFLALATGAIFWDHFRGLFWGDGHALPILNPDLWPWWIGSLLVLMGFEAALAIALYARKRWTADLAVMNTILAVLIMSLLVTLLGNGHLINPEVIAYAGAQHGVESSTFDVLGIVTGFAIVGISVWDIVDGWRKTARARGLDVAVG